MFPHDNFEKLRHEFDSKCEEVSGISTHYRQFRAHFLSGLRVYDKNQSMDEPNFIYCKDYLEFVKNLFIPPKKAVVILGFIEAVPAPTITELLTN